MFGLLACLADLGPPPRKSWVLPWDRPIGNPWGRCPLDLEWRVTTSSNQYPLQRVSIKLLLLLPLSHSCHMSPNLAISANINDFMVIILLCYFRIRNCCHVGHIFALNSKFLREFLWHFWLLSLVRVPSVVQVRVNSFTCRVHPNIKWLFTI